MNSSSQISILLALTLAVGCAADDGAEPGECSVLSHELREGELFDVVAFGHDFSPYCEAGFQAAQDHGQWVADAWGEPPNRFNYGLFASRDEPCWPCRSGALGCAFATHAAATEMPDRHEIAHSIRRVPCPTLLEEGWATLYGAHFEHAATEGDLRIAADARVKGILPGEFYPFAARFVAFLLETYGIDGLKGLCELPINNAESLDSALQEVFGQSLEQVEAVFSNYPAWTLGQLRQDQACEGTDITAIPGNWTMDLVCGAAGVEGREGDRVIAHHLIEVPEDGDYLFRFEAAIEFDLRWELRNCTRDGMASIHYEAQRVHSYEQAKNFPLSLPAGVYVFRLMLEDTSAPLHLQISAQPWL